MPTPLRVAVWCTVALAAAACNGPRVRSTDTQRLRVDRVVLEVADLEQGIATLEQRAGLTGALRGHDPNGQGRAFWRLADGILLELLERPGAPAAPTPVAWAVATDSLDDLRLLLRWHGYATGPETVAACRAEDGTPLQWREVQVTQPSIAGAPEFVVWQQPGAFDAPTASAVRIEGLVIYVENPSRLRQLLRTLGLDVVVRMGRPTGPRMALATARGPVLLGGVGSR